VVPGRCLPQCHDECLRSIPHAQLEPPIVDLALHAYRIGIIGHDNPWLRVEQGELLRHSSDERRVIDRRYVAHLGSESSRDASNLMTNTGTPDRQRCTALSKRTISREDASQDLAAINAWTPRTCEPEHSKYIGSPPGNRHTPRPQFVPVCANLPMSGFVHLRMVVIGDSST
jgi:hypothetical protein